MLFCSCGGSESQFQLATEHNTDEIPDQISYNIDIAFIDSNTTKTLISAGRARVYNSRNETLLDSGVVVYFYNDFGKKTGEMTSVSVLIDDISKDMQAMGDVLVVSDSMSTSLRTELLHWCQSRRKI